MSIVDTAQTKPPPPPHDAPARLNRGAVPASELLGAVWVCADRPAKLLFRHKQHRQPELRPQPMPCRRSKNGPPKCQKTGRTVRGLVPVCVMCVWWAGETAGAEGADAGTGCCGLSPCGQVLLAQPLPGRPDRVLRVEVHLRQPLPRDRTTARTPHHHAHHTTPSRTPHRTITHTTPHHHARAHSRSRKHGVVGWGAHLAALAAREAYLVYSS